MAAGVGVGAQFGAQISDCVFILNTDQSVKAFSTGNVTFAGNMAVAAGPTGRQCEAGGTALHLAPIYSYCVIAPSQNLNIENKGIFCGN